MGSDTESLVNDFVYGGKKAKDLSLLGLSLMGDRGADALIGIIKDDRVCKKRWFLGALVNGKYKETPLGKLHAEKIITNLASTESLTALEYLQNSISTLEAGEPRIWEGDYTGPSYSEIPLRTVETTPYVFTSADSALSRFLDYECEADSKLESNEKDSEYVKHSNTYDEDFHGLIFDSISRLRDSLE